MVNHMNATTEPILRVTRSGVSSRLPYLTVRPTHTDGSTLITCHVCCEHYREPFPGLVGRLEDFAVAHVHK